MITPTARALGRAGKHPAGPHQRHMTVTYNGVRLEIPDDKGWAAHDYILRRLCGEPREDAKFDAIMAEREKAKQ